MQIILPTSIALLLVLASLASWRTWFLGEYYRKHAATIADKEATGLARSETRWRVFAHILWFFCLSPLPSILMPQVVQLMGLIQLASGVVVTGGLILGAIKQMARIELLKLFSRDIQIWNEVALAVLGFLVSFALAIWLAVRAQPGLQI